MERIKDAFVHFFEEEGWEYYKLPAETAYAPGFKLDAAARNGRWMCIANIREERKQVVFYSVCPVTAPENKRHSIAEFVSRANYGMVLGNFEFDFDDGEIRFKTSFTTGNQPATPTLIKQYVYTNIAMMDKYLAGIMAVLYAGALPETAVKTVEG